MIKIEHVAYARRNGSFNDVRFLVKELGVRGSGFGVRSSVFVVRAEAFAKACGVRCTRRSVCEGMRGSPRLPKR